MDIGDQKHLALGLEGAPLGAGHDRPGLVDIQGGAGALDRHQVGMGAGQRPPAVVAHPAPSSRAEERGGEGPSGGPLARTRRAVEQIGMDWPSGRHPELSHGTRLPDDRVVERRSRRVGKGGL